MVQYLGEVDKIKKARLWNDMNTRCYNDKLHDRFPQYSDCEVKFSSKEDFYKWVDENYYTIDGEIIDLDKDILVKGNKDYGRDTCIFAPHSINTLFLSNKKGRGKYPIGVSYDKDRNKYRADFSFNGNRIHLHRWNTPEEAFIEYKAYKEAFIKAVADRYKDKIPQKLYDAMYAWKIEITD